MFSKKEGTKERVKQASWQGECFLSSTEVVSLANWSFWNVLPFSATPPPTLTESFSMLPIWAVFSMHQYNSDLKPSSSFLLHLGKQPTPSLGLGGPCRGLFPVSELPAPTSTNCFLPIKNGTPVPISRSWSFWGGFTQDFAWCCLISTRSQFICLGGQLLEASSQKSLTPWVILPTILFYLQYLGLSEILFHCFYDYNLFPHPHHPILSLVSSTGTMIFPTAWRNSLSRRVLIMWKWSPREYSGTEWKGVRELRNPGKTEDNSKLVFKMTWCFPA